MRRIDEICTGTTRTSLYPLLDGTRITIDDLSHVVSDIQGAVTYTSLAIELVDLFSENTMQSFMVFMHEKDERFEQNFPNNEVQLKLMKPGYMLGE